MLRRRRVRVAILRQGARPANANKNEGECEILKSRRELSDVRFNRVNSRCVHCFSPLADRPHLFRAPVAMHLPGNHNLLEFARGASISALLGRNQRKQPVEACPAISTYQLSGREITKERQKKAKITTKKHPRFANGSAVGRSPLNYQFGEFTLDVGRERVLRAGEEIKLRPKVYDALKYMLEHAGRLVGKQELMQALWPDSAVTDDSLVQCMIELRRALGDRKQQLLQTVTRRGYIFRAEVVQDQVQPDDPFPGSGPFQVDDDRK